MNADLIRERQNHSFCTDCLTHLLDGTAARTATRRRLQAVIERDPTGIFDNSMNSYLHRTDRHVRALAKHVRLIELCRLHGIGNNYNGEILADPDFGLLMTSVADDLPTSLHWVMFVPNIRSLCDAQQQAEWLPLCRDWQMIGCYAQTELGHGSNVRALETTATFVNERKSGIKGGAWEIHSPTLTSTKFWPGTLGKTANTAMVIARLIDGRGVDRGMHNFLVPLRCRQSHKLLPGVVTGDIGPKIGYNTMDNGYARFDRVIIPRRNMAMRFATVDKHGTYKKLAGASSAVSEKVAYITMMQVRAHICNEAGKNLAIAATIAIRYSAVRRQGFVESSVEKEHQILDYKQQQHRLFSLLAASYCFFFTGKKVLQRLKQLEEKLVSSSTSTTSNGSNSNVVAVTRAEMQDVHASSSALKSFTTTVAADGMEDCRKACGGHGFLACSGLPELITTYLQNPTVEGDNFMLPQQVVKVLLKLVHAVQQRSSSNNNRILLSDYESCDSYRLVPSLQAILLHSNKRRERCVAQSQEDMMDLEATLLPAFCHRAARLLVDVAARLKQSKSSQQDAWNEALVLMSRVSRAYSQFLLLQNFVDGIQQERRSGALLGSNETAVLTDLARLFGLYWMERELGDFLEDGYLSQHHAQWVHACVLELLTVIRPNAVALVDAWDFSDFRLKSALGRFDGNVYPAIMEAARRDPLNQTDLGPGYKEHLQRLIVGGVGVYKKHNNNSTNAGTASRL